MKCGACTKAYRAGSGSLAYVHTADGLKRVRVCPPCSRQAIPILPAVAPAVLAGQIRERAKKLADRVDDRSRGMVEGLMRAALFLERGTWAVL